MALPSERPNHARRDNHTERKKKITYLLSPKESGTFRQEGGKTRLPFMKYRALPDRGVPNRQTHLPQREIFGGNIFWIVFREEEKSRPLPLNSDITEGQIIVAFVLGTLWKNLFFHKNKDQMRKGDRLKLRTGN